VVLFLSFRQQQKRKKKKEKKRKKEDENTDVKGLLTRKKNILEN
jgi:hypothetical protein